MDKKDIKQLLDKHKSGEKLSIEEQLLLDSFYLHTAKNTTDEIEEKALTSNLDQVEYALLQKIKKTRTRRLTPWWYAAAASLALAFSATFYIYQSKNSNTTTETQQALFEQVLPGTDKAILELANGEQLTLDSTNLLSTQVDNIQIGERTINLSDRGIQSTALNTLRVPNGGQYKVLLSDGSSAWLNAGSQLRYPTSFASDKREVELIGEAYFEVAHNPKKPFYVRTKDQNIQVLGTGFNISAYPNASTSTTLAHGKVRVTGAGKQTVILRPGEQAYETQGRLQQKKADVNSIIAWKNGIFSFKRSDLQEITAQLERWYDIDVVFTDATMPKRQITGEIPRNVDLYDVVEILSYFDISCQIIGRTVYLDTKK